MKYITLIIGLLVAAGCSKSLTEEEKKVVGSYEAKREEFGDVAKLVLLDNGNIEFYSDGEKKTEKKWKVMDGRVHVSPTTEHFEKLTFGLDRYKIEPNGDLTHYRNVFGKIDEDKQITYKKIK